MPPNDPRSDAQLIAACNRGDEAAFAALYRRHRDYVLRVAQRFCGDRDLALDAMQETFLHLLGRFPGFRLDAGARLTSFLYPVAKHAALAGRRKAERMRGDGDALADRPAPARPAGDAATEVLARLPDEHREVLALRFVDGFTLAEIAAALGLPLGTVKSRLHHGLAKLRDDPATRDFF